MHAEGGGGPPVHKSLPSFQARIRKFLLRSESANITQNDPVVKATYLGNVVTTWAKGEGALERPASALWKNHVQGRGSIRMTVVVSAGGLRAETREHGVTEYWNNRLTWCGSPKDYPKLFCWIYRHEGRKLKQELRCHAVLCGKEEARMLCESLRYRLAEALFDFRKEKIQRQNARLSSTTHLSTLYALTDSTNNYKRERASPSKLSVIEELEEEAMLCDLRDYDKVLDLMDLDPSLFQPNPHSLSSSPCSDSSLSSPAQDENQSPPTPLLYQQICFQL